MSDPEIGTAEWWQTTPRDGARGTTDTILRLLEQEEISRAKARELLAWDRTAPSFADPPPAPWDRLNWCDDGDPLSVTVALGVAIELCAIGWTAPRRMDAADAVQPIGYALLHRGHRP